ncbi:M20 family metallo-hydrolase [Alicyclobacillus mengziensis]|uniref:M20 family metallo-hydrolase n=1 Tax=Alicyclobacillus mengziensis TaxID=2931921 RepID=A0A9X7VYI6_9BACL|nr:M20 family metallo-hydrolase [Alicyclobacillus mengziensis]QSO47409.1 M20 family metallo-hydrolase [Alicyclobacillus mengziensis]
MKIQIDEVYIQRMIDRLAEMHEPGTLYARRSFTEVYRKSREWLKEEMRKLGLSVSVDRAANLIGLYGSVPGDSAGLVGGEKAVWAIGSHTDTVANGGRFDGIAGVVSGLAVVKALSEAGYRLKRPLAVIDFLAEEPCAFGLSTVGSRGMAGRLSPEMLRYEDDAGRTLAEGIQAMGGDPSKLTQPLCSSDEVKGFLELHIEQGPVLEKEGLDIGIVTGIAGIRRYRVTVTGEQGHSGTVPMTMRKDALVAASEMVTRIHQLARHASESAPCVATVGVLDVGPNHANVIPGRVTFTVETRSIDASTLANLSWGILQQVKDVANSHGVTSEFISLSETSPVTSDPHLLDILHQSAASLGLTKTELPSGAGHDAAQMASIAPTAMVFIPCRGGLSHHPDEFSTYEQVARGASVLAEAIVRLNEEEDNA